MLTRAGFIGRGLSELQQQVELTDFFQLKYSQRCADVPGHRGCAFTLAGNYSETYTYASFSKMYPTFGQSVLTVTSNGPQAF